MPDAIVCKTCESQGLTSNVKQANPLISRGSLKAFKDSEGRGHSHSTAITEVNHRCSNGHSWTVTIKNPCWCGWGK